LRGEKWFGVLLYQNPAAAIGQIAVAESLFIEANSFLHKK
jgi:hypothetical protein